MSKNKFNIGRNVPCPCGSRKMDGTRQKYKKCCIGKHSPFSVEFIEKMNKRVIEDNNDEHLRFIEMHNQNICYLCDLPYEVYDKQKPCLHWLLRPKGTKKEDVELILNQKGYFSSQAFLRWVANTESFGCQINDLSGEGDLLKVIELTISYKNMEWSFSCSKNDFEGHRNSQVGKDPHFHLEMKIDNRPFIGFSDFHIKFSGYDIFTLEVQQRKYPGLVYEHKFGVGMEDLMNIASDHQLKGMQVTDDENLAQFNLETLVMAKPGTSISGDEVEELINESKRTGIPMAKLMHRLQNVTVQTVVQPGPGVVEKKVRSKTR